MKVLRRVFFFCLILCVLSRWSTAQERDASHSRNYQNCLYGRYGCDPSQLTADEQQAVARSGHSRNYQNCLYGRYGCDPSQLTADEQQAVARSDHSRNYQNCLYGRYGCNPAQLTDTEQTQVHQAAHQRNLNNCLHGYSGCDLSQLTASEQASVTVNKRDSVGADAEPTPAQTTPPHFYINKDGQRVQSPTYSKTVPPGATAQCRDGTYSFSRNHRGTCSHHGGVSKWLD
jgi:hypothetical protein